MARPMTEREREEFLAALHVAVLSVQSDDGRPPLAVPVFYHYAPGGNLTFFTNTQGTRSRKVRLITKAQMLTFVVQQENPPYKFVMVEGSVVDAARPPEAEAMLPIVRRYMPEEYAQGFVQGELSHPDSQLVLYTVRPDRWSSTDFSEEPS
jgi:nitroimidazol reductase NimA-like FMN-containing flavoprotein (pyridoxamine 5'-phosphate oxidase superfamily)